MSLEGNLPPEALLRQIILLLSYDSSPCPVSDFHRIWRGFDFQLPGLQNRSA
jgi:hypothetical protein